MKNVIVCTLLLAATTRAGEIPRGTYVTGCVKNAETGQGICDALAVVTGPMPSESTAGCGPTDVFGGYLVRIDEQRFQAGVYRVGAFTPGYYNFPTPEHEISVTHQDDIYLVDDIEKFWNPPPTVDAGIDVSTTDAFTPQTVQLNGSVTDDGTILDITWNASGPGNASFLDASDPKTTVTFDALGRYELELYALDDIGAASTDTVIAQIGETTGPKNGWISVW